MRRLSIDSRVDIFITLQSSSTTIVPASPFHFWLFWTPAAPQMRYIPQSTGNGIAQNPEHGSNARALRIWTV
jgi:hypothetical protein